MSKQMRAVKLSTLIRIGARMSKKTSGTLFREHRSCAIGAAAIGLAFLSANLGRQKASAGLLGYSIDRREDGKILSQYIRAEDTPSGTSKCSLSGIIIDLNDNKGWSREHIADWLDQLPEDRYDLTVEVEVSVEESKDESVSYSTPPHFDPTTLDREESWDKVPEKIHAVV